MSKRHFYTFTFIEGPQTTWANSNERVAGYVTAFHTKADRDEYVAHHDRIQDHAVSVATLRRYGVTRADLVTAGRTGTSIRLQLEEFV